MKSLYGGLGVEPEATGEQIKAAHRKAAKKYHPDKAGGCREKFQRVQHAYDVLSDPDKRRHYDETGDDGSKRTGEPTPEQLIAMAWTHVLEQIDPRRNLLDALRDALLEGRRQTEAALIKSQAKLKRLTMASERLQAGEGSVLRSVLDLRIAEMKATVAGEQRGAELLLEASNLVMSTGLSYRADETPSYGHENATQAMLDEILRGVMGGHPPRGRNGGGTTFRGL